MIKNKNKEDTCDNSISGSVFHGGMQIADTIINNISEQGTLGKKPVHESEPVWRSPITMAALTWISVIIGLLSIFVFR